MALSVTTLTLPPNKKSATKTGFYFLELYIRCTFVDRSGGSCVLDWGKKCAKTLWGRANLLRRRHLVAVDRELLLHEITKVGHKRWHVISTEPDGILSFSEVLNRLDNVDAKSQPGSHL